MPRCPFASWVPADTADLSFSGGPPKIVHHTTEGSTAAAAVAAFRANRSWPHFTVHADGVMQHIDTKYASRALRNAAGGVETNTDTAYQIEVVGFAAQPKHIKTLGNVARLCRWIEETHNVATVWPNGYPKVAVDGRDPGGHNRDARTWDTTSGHYGHCHVPENTHWDPGYTATEVRQIMPPPAQVIVTTTTQPKKEKFVMVIMWHPNGQGFLVFPQVGTRAYVALPGDVAALKAAGTPELTGISAAAIESFRLVG